MYLPDVELHEAESLEEASGLMTRFAPNARLLAGGTDLLVDLKTARVTADHLVSVNRVASLRGIDKTQEGLRIGALTTITQLDRHPIVRQRFAPLCDATSQMAAPQIRNVATVGGNIVCAVPCADLPPILTAMNASVTVWSTSGERIVAMDSFFVGVRQTVLESGELLTGVLVPDQPAGFGAAYARFSLREGNSIAVAGVAAGIQLDSDGRMTGARVVLAAVSPTPKLVAATKDILVGEQPGDTVFAAMASAAAEAADPICDIRGSDEFRREIVAVMTRRALVSACSRAKESRA